MGCGASQPAEKAFFTADGAPAAAPRVPGGLQTPPGSRRPSDPGNRSGMPTAKAKAAGLRIDTSASSREKVGMAETPQGKVAEEYKYCACALASRAPAPVALLAAHTARPVASPRCADCPICMMFFRSIVELPCCGNTTCAFCLGEYLQKLEPLPATDGELAAAIAAAPAVAAGGRTLHDLQLPAGRACPQCRVVCKASRPLRLLQRSPHARESHGV
jgi:hypothetical protein